jgi:phosphoribosylamine--glycine ligase
MFAAPGNAGTAKIATNLDIKTTDFEALAKAVKQNHIELIVVGPEDPLAEGVVDYFQKIGMPIFGPNRAAAQLEASKAFSKELFRNMHPRQPDFQRPVCRQRICQKQPAPLS